MTIARALMAMTCAIFMAQKACADGSTLISNHIVELGAQGKVASHAQLANAWWQWVASAPRGQDPVSDISGERCALNQDGLVWYLAGGFGSSKIARSCTVPADRFIFFPVINMLVSVPVGSSVTCDGAKKEAAKNNDTFVYIQVSLDGEKLENAERFRVASQDCFDLMAQNPETSPDAPFGPSATDGYWILLRPLPAGKHKLEFKAFYTNQDAGYGDMVQNISYDLLISEP